MTNEAPLIVISHSMMSNVGVARGCSRLKTVLLQIRYYDATHQTSASGTSATKGNRASDRPIIRHVVEQFLLVLGRPRKCVRIPYCATSFWRRIPVVIGHGLWAVAAECGRFTQHRKSEVGSPWAPTQSAAHFDYPQVRRQSFRSLWWNGEGLRG